MLPVSCLGYAGPTVSSYFVFYDTHLQHYGLVAIFEISGRLFKTSLCQKLFL